MKRRSLRGRIEWPDRFEIIQESIQTKTEISRLSSIEKLSFFLGIVWKKFDWNFHVVFFLVNNFIFVLIEIIF